MSTLHWQSVVDFVWTVTFLFPDRSVREQTVPVEFTNVPPGGDDRCPINRPGWFRCGSVEPTFSSVKLEALVARCELTSAQDGRNDIELAAGAFNVPFGLRIEGFTPRQVTVRLERNSVAPEQP